MNLQPSNWPGLSPTGPRNFLVTSKNLPAEIFAVVRASWAYCSGVEDWKRLPATERCWWRNSWRATERRTNDEAAVDSQGDVQLFRQQTSPGFIRYLILSPPLTTPSTAASVTETGFQLSLFFVLRVAWVTENIG